MIKRKKEREKLSGKKLMMQESLQGTEGESEFIWGYCKVWVKSWETFNIAQARNLNNQLAIFFQMTPGKSYTKEKHSTVHFEVTVLVNYLHNCAV